VTKQTASKQPAHIIITGDNAAMTQQSLNRAQQDLRIKRVFVAGATDGDMAAIKWCAENKVPCLLIPPTSELAADCKRGGNVALLLAAIQGGKKLKRYIIVLPGQTKRTANLLSQARTSYSEGIFVEWDRSNDLPA